MQSHDDDTESLPATSSVRGLEHFCTLMHRQGLFWASDWKLEASTPKEQVEHCRPQLIARWIYPGKAPNRCPSCHLPMYEVRRGGSHLCAFAPCSSYRYCLGAYKESTYPCFGPLIKPLKPSCLEHEDEVEELRKQKSQQKQANVKRKQDERKKDSDVKKQKKENCALKMGRFAAFSKRVGEETAQATYNEAVVDLRGDSELEQEQQIAEGKLKKLISESEDTNPMFSKARARVQELRSELTEAIRPAHKQSYYSPPSVRTFTTPRVTQGAQVIRQPLSELTWDQLVARKQENEQENKYVSWWRLQDGKKTHLP